MKLSTCIKIKISSGYYCSRIDCYNTWSNRSLESKVPLQGCRSHKFCYAWMYALSVLHLCYYIHRNTLYLYNLLYTALKFLSWVKKHVRNSVVEFCNSVFYQWPSQGIQDFRVICKPSKTIGCSSAITAISWVLCNKAFFRFSLEY